MANKTRSNFILLQCSCNLSHSLTQGIEGTWEIFSYAHFINQLRLIHYMSTMSCLPENKFHYTNEFSFSIALCQWGTQSSLISTEKTRAENLIICPSQSINKLSQSTYQASVKSWLLSDTIPCKVRSCTQICLAPKSGLLLLGYPVFPLSTCSHNGTGLGKNDLTCPWGCLGGTESRNLRTRASWFQQWHWVSGSDWLLSTIKSGWDKAVIWVSRSRNKRKERQKTCKSWIRKLIISPFCRKFCRTENDHSSPDNQAALLDTKRPFPQQGKGSGQIDC